jgi:peptide/nickel transport system ATP-binding protein
MNKLLGVSDLKKYFKVNSGWLHAVDGVSFSVEEGKTLGIVGESGCGKSTLGRTILHLHESTDGVIEFEGEDITRARGNRLNELRRKMQIIFQDPYASLNPRMTLSETIGEPLRIFRVCPKREINKKVKELMSTVGLAGRFAQSYPHELDGGRRQRIGIARALALDPKFIVCDEPVSALDVSIQAQILNLMQDLQAEKHLTYLFITHNLSVVKHISNQIMVMYLGCMVEYCATDDLFEHRYHPYTKALLSAIPIPDIDVNREKMLLKGEISSPINPSPGCRFAPRCDFAKQICSQKTPLLEDLGGDHFVACHCAKEVNNL